MKNGLVWKCAIAAMLLAGSAVSSASPFAYFVDTAAGSVTPIDVANNQVLPPIAVGHHPISVAAVPVGHSVYVGNQGERGTCVIPSPGGGGGGSIPPTVAPYLSIIDSSSRNVVAKINLPLMPALMQASSDSTLLYIVGTDPATPCASDSFFGIFDTASRQLVKRVALPANPTDMVVDTSHSRVYLRSGTEVDIVHGSTGGILTRIDVGPTPPLIAPFVAGLALDEANGRVYAGTEGSVTAIDTSTHAVLWRAPTTANPLSLALVPSGSGVLVGEIGGGVELLDVTRRVVARSFTLPAGVPSVAVSPDGKTAYVASAPGTANSATPIRISDWTLGAARSIGAATTGGQFIGNLSDPAGYMPDALTGLWWNPAQPGWGMHLTEHGHAIFAVWFTYDEIGNPKWYVAPNCSANAVPTKPSDANCTSDLFEVHGATFFGGPFNPRNQRGTVVGSLQLRFTDVDNAGYTATVNGNTIEGSIQRQVFRNDPVSGTSFTDLWNNPTESGWGLGIAHQGDVMFLTWFVYDDAGNPEWLVASNCAVKSGGDGCTGTLYSTSGPRGPAAGVPFDPSKVNVVVRGEVDVTFDGPDAAVIRYKVDGQSGAKAIIRQIF